MNTDFRTPLAKVRGLGAAGNGTDHFLGQRISAIALAILLPTFAVSVILATDGGHESVTAWLRTPYGAGLCVLLALTALFHMRIGLQTVIEDYLHRPTTKIAALLANTFIPAVLAVLAVLSVLRIFTGA
jgi:succinate dehydrogenase / fumarate reductase membrane anchor subunit